MNEKLRKIINYYGIDSQLKYLQTEVFELNKAIIENRNIGAIETFAIQVTNLLKKIKSGDSVDCSKEHITEELADVMVMLKQIQLFYNIPTKDIKKVMVNKTNRQLERIKLSIKENIGGIKSEKK